MALLKEGRVGLLAVIVAATIGYVDGLDGTSVVLQDNYYGEELSCILDMLKKIQLPDSLIIES